MTIYLAAQASSRALVVDVKGYRKEHGTYAKPLKREHGPLKNDRFGQGALVSEPVLSPAGDDEENSVLIKYLKKQNGLP